MKSVVKRLISVLGLTIALLSGVAFGQTNGPLHKTASGQPEIYFVPLEAGGGTPSPGQAEKLARIRLAITAGHTKLLNKEYIAAVDLFKDAVGVS